MRAAKAGINDVAVRAAIAGDARGVLHGIFDAYLALWAASPDALRLSTRTGGIYFELFRDLHTPFRERITALLPQADGGVLFATANPGSLAVLARKVAPTGTFTCKAIDAQGLRSKCEASVAMQEGKPDACPLETFETGLRKTVQWYLDNPQWVANVQSGAYRDWLARNYEAR